MITLNLDKTTEQEINDIAKATGKNIGQVLTDIIKTYLEDRYDVMLAEKAIDELMKNEDHTLSWTNQSKASMPQTVEVKGKAAKAITQMDKPIRNRITDYLKQL